MEIFPGWQLHTAQIARQVDRTVNVLSLKVLAILAGLEGGLERVNHPDGGVGGAPLARRSRLTEEEEYGKISLDEVVIERDVHLPLPTHTGFVCTKVMITVSHFGFRNVRWGEGDGGVYVRGRVSGYPFVSFQPDQGMQPAGYRGVGLTGIAGRSAQLGGGRAGEAGGVGGCSL